MNSSKDFDLDGIVTTTAVGLSSAPSVIQETVRRVLSTDAGGSNIYGTAELSMRLYSMMQYEVLADRKKVLQFIIGNCPALGGEGLRFLNHLLLDNHKELKKFESV